MSKKLISAVMVAMMLTGNIPVIYAQSPVKPQENEGLTNQTYTDTADGTISTVNVMEETYSLAETQIPMVRSIGKESIVSNYPNYGSEEHKKYAEAFEVTGIKSYSNNGGQYGESALVRAFDDNLNTHWETGRQNAGSFKNEIIVTFENVEEINRIIYGARKDAGNKGFAQEFSIYSSMSDSGNDFELVTTGKANKQGGTVQIQFEPTEFKRLKFVFDQCAEGWASVSELRFFKEDKVLDELNNVFTNGLMMELQPKYQDKQVLGKYLDQLKAHVNADKYKGLIENIENAMNGHVVDKESVQVLKPRGHETEERNRAKISYAQYGNEPTGIYLTKGDKLKVYVDADANGYMPEIVIGTSHFIELQPGYNEITLPEEFSGPSIIYLANRGYSHQQAYSPSVRIEGGYSFPTYIHGKTDPVEFMNCLEEYMQDVTYDFDEFKTGNPDELKANFCVLSSDNVLIETSAAGAYAGLKSQLETEGKYVDYTMDTHEEMYREFVEYSGFDYEYVEGREWNYRPMGKFFLVGSTGGPFGWAQHGFTGYNGGGGKRDSGFWASLPTASIVKNGGWALFHEVAHQYDNAFLVTQESTNNLYALHMQDKYGIDNRMVQENRWENHFTNYHNTKVYPNDLLFLGAITYQLELLYGDHIYGDAQRIARENKDNWTDGMNNKQRHAVALSMGLGLNVLPHYEYYGIEMNDRAKSLVEHLPETGLKTYYVNDKVGRKDAIPFTVDANEVKPVVKANGTGQVTLKMSVDQPEEAVLVYEVYRDGEYLGVTYGDTFVDKAPILNKEHTYTVKVYDRKLNVSSESEPVTINASQPKIITKGDIVVPIHSEFDALQFVRAVDVKGNDITSSLEVTNSNVDTSAKGTYTVEYTAKDIDGNTSVMTKEVKVVSDLTYLTDLTPKKTQGSYKKDTDENKQTISLIDENGENEYARGIGAHANTTVIYDVSNLKYDYLETYVGLDDAVRNQAKASVTFEIYLDGEKAYESGVVKAKDHKEYVKLPIEGVQEIKLVTTDAGDGRDFDHAVFGDARLVKENGVPELNICSETVAIELGGNLDLMEGVTATDTEDGNMTEQVHVNTNGFDANKSGVYNIEYSVTDSEGNAVTKTKKVVVYSKGYFASDLQYSIKQSGWNGIQKDKSPSKGIISLLVDGEETTFEKGLGAHANSQVEFDIEGKGYKSFVANIGVAKEMRDSKDTSVKFKVLVDGEEVINSKTFKGSDNSQAILVDVEGASTVTLITDSADGKDTADHSVWGNAQFLVTESKPELTIPKDKNVKVGESFDDIFGEYSAIDAEDGDLTDEVVVTGNVNFDVPGKYTITYTVTDSSGQVVELVRTISVVDMRNFNFVSDFDWKSASTEYGSVRKDLAPNGDTIRLTDENNQEVVFEKGLGAHATSIIKYDLENIDAEYFSSYVGIDRAMYGSVGSVRFEVWLDGEKVAEIGTIGSRDAMEYIEVNLEGAKELMLVADSVGGNGSDHSVWADAKFHIVGKGTSVSDKSALAQLVQDVQGVELSNYTEESAKNLTDTLEKALDILMDKEATQDVIDEMTKELQKVIDSSVIIGDKSELTQLVMELQLLELKLYTEESAKNLTDVMQDVILPVLQDKEATPDSISNALAQLKQVVDNLVKKSSEVDKSELTLLFEEVQSLDSKLYTEESYRTLLNFVESEVVKVLNDQNTIQQVVDETTSEMKQLIDGLIIIGDKSELVQLVMDLQLLELKLYTEESTKNLTDVMQDVALPVLQDKEATPDSISNTLTQLKQAIANLVEKLELVD